jgi:hypothetical protein
MATAMERNSLCAAHKAIELCITDGVARLTDDGHFFAAEVLQEGVIVLRFAKAAGQPLANIVVARPARRRTGTVC